MNRKFLSFVFLAFAFSSVLFATYELRTPLSLQSKLNLINGSFHYPIGSFEDEEELDVTLWAGGYYRHACEGYCPKVCDWCCSACDESCVTYACDSTCGSCNSGASSCSFGNCNGNEICLSNSDYIGCVDCNKKKISLAQLFFGKSAFYGREAFGTKDTAGNKISFAEYPELTDFLLIPKIEYKEKGVVVGCHVEKKVACKKWRVGFNASLPIKSVQVVRRMSCEAGGPGLIDVTHDLKSSGTVIDPTKDRLFCKYEYLYDTDLNTFNTPSIGETCAFRFDFLRELTMPDGRPLVDFTPTGSVIIADVDLSAKENLTFSFPGGVATPNQPIVYPAVAYRPRNDDIFPAIKDPYRSDFDADGTEEPIGASEISLAAMNPGLEEAVAYKTAVNPLPANGAIGENRRLHFDPDTDYTPLSTMATSTWQDKIFIIPGYHRDRATNVTLYTRGALQIKNTVQYILSQMDELTEGIVTGDIEAIFKGGANLFVDNGICLNESHCIAGLGDLDASLFFGYDFTDRSYLEIVAGMRFPTGRKNRCPGSVYFVPTGNNGHFEAKLGLDGGWRSKRWFGIRADVSYSHVLEAVEKKPAAFKCASIRGIGPCIDAKVKWGYFLGHLDLTVFHPRNQCMGFALGYEFYYKRHDKVKFCACDRVDRLRDLLGNIVELDSSLLEKNTNVLAHKIRGQAYHRWNYFELYLGASKVVGGRNGMSENEVHIGCGIDF